MKFAFQFAQCDWWSVCLLLAVMLSSGCGEKEAARLDVFPVKGKLLVNGVPAERAEVTMMPAVPLPDPGKRSVVPYAHVQPDGTFLMSTYAPGDGAPLGEYAVTVVWPKITLQGGEEIIGQDMLRNRFSDAHHPAATFVVQDGDNEIPPIELKAK